MKQIRAVFAVSTLCVSLSYAGNTTVLFQPDKLAVGPFPSDQLTVAASGQKTGRQVSIPTTPSFGCGFSMPGQPAFRGAVCGDPAPLNVLDGFSVNPRSMVCFSDAVDVSTLKGGISYISVDNPTTRIGVNQLYFDAASNCAYMKPDQVLRQQATYVLAVMNTVQDAKGANLTQNPAFTACVKGPGANCGTLAAALDKSGSRGEASSGRMIAATSFTTMSATNWLEKARQYVSDHQPGVILPAGIPAVLSQLKSLTWLPQDNAPTQTTQDIPLSALSNVDGIFFGLFLSPNFLNVSGAGAGTITSIPGNAAPAPIAVPGQPALVPPGYALVSFHLFLPKIVPPAGGFPVVIYGHGLGDNQFGASTFIASTLAAKGYATLSMEIFGHGFGPGGTVQMVMKNGFALPAVATPGRAVPLGGQMGTTDGCIVPGAVAVRDCARQSAVDLFALVRSLQLTNGYGYVDTDRIYYVGQSFGGTYGSLFHAVEPGVSAAVLNSSGGTSVDVARLALTGRPLGWLYLGGMNPPLLNVNPVIGAPSPDYYHDIFNDEYVFRDLDPVVSKVPGAPVIQAAFETADWAGMQGDPLAYAQHFRTAPLAGVPAKRTLFQFGVGDIEVPNPTESALVRAAGGQGTTWMLKTDVAASLQRQLLGIVMPSSPGGPPLPILPHRFLSNPTIFSDPAEQALALAGQLQVAAFLSGQANPDPNPFLDTIPGSPFTSGMKLFVVPAALPEQMNFLPNIPK